MPAPKRVRPEPTVKQTSPSMRPYLHREHDFGSEAPPQSDHILASELTTIEEPYPAARRACRWGGLALAIFGTAGFGVPGAFGAHLTDFHNLIHLLSGVLLMLIGIKARPVTVRAVSLVFGAAYALFGVAGYFFGRAGISSVAPLGYDPFLWVISPNRLELGQNDHALHLLIGAVYLFAGLRATRSMFSSKISFD